MKKLFIAGIILGFIITSFFVVNIRKDLSQTNDIQNNLFSEKMLESQCKDWLKVTNPKNHKVYYYNKKSRRITPIEPVACTKEKDTSYSASLHSAGMNNPTGRTYLNCSTWKAVASEKTGRIYYYYNEAIRKRSKNLPKGCEDYLNIKMSKLSDAIN